MEVELLVGEDGRVLVPSCMSGDHRESFVAALCAHNEATRRKRQGKSGAFRMKRVNAFGRFLYVSKEEE